MHNAGMSHSQQDLSTRAACFVQAYAKINLTLEVLERRADGYHALSTVMQTVDLYDTLYLAALDEDEVRIACSRPELGNQENLAYRAARLLRERYAIRQGVAIELHKRIPVAAGLGGGSSDAAAVLRALPRLWQVPVAPEDLREMAASLGSDVPFFLSGGLALCEGRGEIVTPLAPGWPSSMRWLLLLKPAIEVNTASIFGHVIARDYTRGAFSRAVVAALQAGSAPRAEDLHNGLERTALELHPAVAQARADLLSATSSIVRLSGSGPTLYAPFSNLSRAVAARERMQAQGYEVYLSRAIYPDMGPVNVLYK
jgi:4-diphosphocytidyl-2-C-methyl-D-erythritol kinase